MRLSTFLPILFLLAAACSRPLTPAEEAFANDVFGPSLDTSKVRVALNFGLHPARPTEPGDVRFVEGTDKACLRVPQPRGSQAPKAFALRNRVHFDSDLYSSDLVLEWPGVLRVPQALILAHELTHVWQWQNREETGYSAGRAFMESVRLADPYFSDRSEEFFAFGYEQQAAILEDYICFAFANPNHPRRALLREVLAPVFPIDHLDAVIGQ